MATLNISNQQTQTAETQSKISPSMAVNMLIEGNKRLYENDCSSQRGIRG